MTCHLAGHQLGLGSRILRLIAGVAFVLPIWVFLRSDGADIATSPPPNEIPQAVDPAPRTVPSFPRPSPNEAKIQRTLNASTSVKWEDFNLEEAFSELEKQHGIEIWIDKQALSESGMTTDQEVTLSMEGISLRSCLRLILEPWGLVYVIEDDVLKITSPQKRYSSSVTRIYPVGDLCDTDDEAKQLLETIECGLGMTRDADGVPCLAVSSRMKTLTVRHSYVVQQKVEELLLALRDAQSVPVNNDIKPLQQSRLQ